MSSLGIRNVLPYQGGNGIVVNNNIIEIDPTANVEFNTLTLNPDAVATGVVLTIVTSDIGGDALNVVNDGQIEMRVGNDGIIDNYIAGNADSQNISTGKLFTRGVDNNSPEFSVDSVAVAAVGAPSGKFQMTINGQVVSVLTDAIV